MVILLDYEPLKDSLFNTMAFEVFLAIKAEIQKRLHTMRSEILLSTTMIIIAIKPGEKPVKVEVLESDQYFKLKVLEHLNGIDFEAVIMSKIQKGLN